MPRGFDPAGMIAKSILTLCGFSRHARRHQHQGTFNVRPHAGRRLRRQDDLPGDIAMTTTTHVSCRVSSPALRRRASTTPSSRAASTISSESSACNGDAADANILRAKTRSSSSQMVTIEKLLEQDSAALRRGQIEDKPSRQLQQKGGNDS